MGEVTDSVIRFARTDIMLVKLVGEGLPFKRLLLPSAGGEHARAAMRYARDLLRNKLEEEDTCLTLCSVVSPDAEAERVQAEEARLQEASERLKFPHVDARLVRHGSVVEGILEELESHDALVIGAAGQSFSSQILFGSIPESIARASKRPVIVVKRHHAVKALVGRIMNE